MLLALGDGRALPASRLAGEAGVSPATASAHLRKLLDAGLLTAEPHGRHRYYRIAGPQVGHLIETMATLAPDVEVRSLRQDVRGRALRDARTCYDHLAGRLGVALMRGMLDRGWVRGGDGRFDPETARQDRLSAYGHDIPYELSDAGAEFLASFGVTLPPRRPVIRYCVDWSEQAHHLAGGLGRGLRDRLLELDWVRAAERSRAVELTELGRAGVTDTFAVRLDG